MFHPSEVELSETTRAVLARVGASQPVRVVFDSLSEMRLLAQNQLRYRRQILALKHFFVGRRCTVLLLDDNTSAELHEMQLQSLAHGVISLEHVTPEYGAERRHLRVVKMRGREYRGGYHDFNIVKGGLEVFPRIVAAEHAGGFERGEIASGRRELDQLLGGGLPRGSSTLLMGPAGTGKSSVATQYALAAAERSEKVTLFAFDEREDTFLEHAAGMSMALEPFLERGLITIKQVDPAELSPGEFVQLVRDSADKNGARLVVIDSLNGYVNAMPEERFLLIQLHELFTYLGQKGVSTILVVAQPGLLGDRMEAPVNASYLADSIILFRYFEAMGEVRKAVSALKKRSGAHEQTICELKIDASGLHLGEPLREFQGILTGVPAVHGHIGTLKNA